MGISKSNLGGDAMEWVERTGMWGEMTSDQMWGLEI